MAGETGCLQAPSPRGCKDSSRARAPDLVTDCRADSVSSWVGAGGSGQQELVSPRAGVRAGARPMLAAESGQGYPTRSSQSPPLRCRTPPVSLCTPTPALPDCKSQETRHPHSLWGALKVILFQACAVLRSPRVGGGPQRLRRWVGLGGLGRALEDIMTRSEPR